MLISQVLVNLGHLSMNTRLKRGQVLMEKGVITLPDIFDHLSFHNSIHSLPSNFHDSAICIDSPKIRDSAKPRQL